MDTLQAIVEFLSGTAIRATFLLVLATIAAFVLKQSSPAVRHRMWSLTLLSLLFLPIASHVLPVWSIPILPAFRESADSSPDHASEKWIVNRPQLTSSQETMTDVEPAARGEATRVARQSAMRTDVPADAVHVPSGMSPAASPPTLEVTQTDHLQPAAGQNESQADSFSLVVVLLWMSGTCLLTIAMLVNVVRTIRFCRQSTPVDGEVWKRLLSEACRRLQLSRRVDLREHADPIVPLTCGIVQPVIVLPTVAHEWDGALQRSVLTHELAHVKRRDVVVQFLGRLACTMYWFHPLAWYALRRMRHEGERACDDEVVAAGEKASDYARQLLRVAELCCAPRGLTHGVAMAEGSHLELRVQSLFDAKRQRGPVRRTVLAAMVAGCLSILVIAGAATPVAVEAQTPANGLGESTTPTAADEAITADARPPAGTDETVARAGATGTTPGVTASTPGTKWIRGSEALQRIIDLRPAFGPEQGGLKLGLAFSKPQRVFRIGDRLPVELFLINVSDRQVTTRFIIDFLFDTPLVENADGQRITIPRLATFMRKRRHELTLAPGEACGIPTIGLGFGKTGRVSFESPTVGKYRCRYRLAGLTSGPIRFEALEEEPGRLRFNAANTPLSSPERLSVIKPEFGEAHGGIQLGLAFSTLQRTFAYGEVIPLEVYVRNVGNKETAVVFHPDMNWSPPEVLNSAGETLRIVPLPVWLFEPPVNVTLKPGETYGVFAPGFRVSESRSALAFVNPEPGTYRLRLARRVSEGDESREHWHEDLATDTLGFEIIETDEGKRSVRLLDTRDRARQSDASAAVLPKHKTAIALLKRWQALEDRITPLSNETVHRLRYIMKNWGTQPPGTLTAAGALALRDWKIDRDEHPVEEVVAWLDEIAAIHPVVVQYALNGERRVGATLSDAELKKLKFGPVGQNGLRAAWSHSPAKDAYVVGDVVSSSLVLQNATDTTVDFQYRGSLFDIVNWDVRTSDGNEVDVKRTWYSGTVPLLRHRLKPGEVAVIGRRTTAIGAGPKNAATVLHVEPGEQVTARWNVHDPVEMKTGDVSFNVVAAGDSPPDEVPPAKSPTSGSKENDAAARSETAPPDRPIASRKGRIRSANHSGQFRLSKNRTLFVCRPTEYPAWLTIVWPESDKWPKSRLRIHPKLKVENRRNWAIVWEHESDELWYVDDSGTTRVDISNPAEVLTTHQPNDKPAILSFEVPQPIKTEFARLGFAIKPAKWPEDLHVTDGQQMLAAETFDRWIVEGSVTNSDGKAMSGVPIHMRSANQSSILLAATKTDESGRYRIETRLSLRTVARYRGLYVKPALEGFAEESPDMAGQFEALLRKDEKPHRVVVRDYPPMWITGSYPGEYDTGPLRRFSDNDLVIAEPTTANFVLVPVGSSNADP